MNLTAIFLVIATIQNQKPSSNFGCEDYKQALYHYDNPWTLFSQNNSARFYSQAPAGKSLGKCNTVPCVGSPVFLIEKAHTWINQ